MTVWTARLDNISRRSDGLRGPAAVVHSHGASFLDCHTSMVIFVMTGVQDGQVVRHGRSDSSWDAFARELGLNLARARSARGLSQERVAHIADISSYTYQKYEKGESRPGTPLNPQLKTLVALSQTLDVPLVELLPSWSPDLTNGG